MTIDEAIEILQGVIKKPNTKDGYLGQAIDMAIKALEQEPCEDAISRQAVLDMLQMRLFGKELYIAVHELPSVTPQPKTGRWIRFKDFENGYYHIKCSECGQYWSVDGHAKIFKYCFNCGAKMEVEE